MNHDRPNRGAERSGIPGEALPLARALGQQARQRRRPERSGVLAPHRRILLALTALLGVLIAIPTIATPASAAAPAVSAAKDQYGFPLYYQDANGVRIDSCLDEADTHCVLLPNPGIFDPAQPLAFPTNFPDEFFYSVVDTDRIPTPNCGLGAGFVSMRIGLEGTFGTGVPAAGDQMVFGRVRMSGRNLCRNTDYHIKYPYGTFEIRTDSKGTIRTNTATVDIGCGPPLPGAPCNFAAALNSPILSNGFLRWDTGADPGYLGGDPATLHTITGGIAGYNQFQMWQGTNEAGPLIGQTNLFTIGGGRIAGPLVSNPSTVDFGGITTGTTSPARSVQITNVGASPVTFTGFSTQDARFQVVGSGTCQVGAALAVDTSCTVDVTFTPSDTGLFPVDPLHAPVLLQVAHDGLHSPFGVSLQGTGVNDGASPTIIATPTTLNFGEVRVGVLSDAQTVAISNDGSAPLLVQQVLFTDAVPGSGERAAFRLLNDGCTNVFVAAGGVAHCDLGVSFEPLAPKAYAANLEIHGNVGGDPVQVTLDATGIGGVAAVAATIDPTDGFPDWYQDEAGIRVGQCLDAADPMCIVLPDDSYAGGPVVGIVPPGDHFENFPGEFFWYVADSDLINTPGCGAASPPGKAFMRFAVEGTFINGVPVVDEQMVFGRIRLSVTSGLCPGVTYTFTNPYGSLDFVADTAGGVRRVTGTTDIGCVPAGPPDLCDFSIALKSPVLGGFIEQVNHPAGYLGDPNVLGTVTGAPYIAQREIDIAVANGLAPKDAAHANYFRITEKANPANLDLETDQFFVMGKLAGPLVADPNPADFNTIEVGQSSSAKVVTLTNTGSNPLTVSGLALGGAFSGDYSFTDVDCVGAVLASGGQCTFNVTFSPSANGARPAQVIVTHDGRNNPLAVKLTGIGGAPVGNAAFSAAPLAFTFPDLHTGERSASEPITISNIGGSAPLHVTGATLAGADPADFEVTSNCPTALDAGVDPGASCIIDVRFAPATAGAKSATLTITHDAVGVPDGAVTLNGYGFAGTSATGPNDAANGFASYYQDVNGVRVEGCLTSGDPNCILLADAGYNPAQPVVFPTNFPTEFFYWIADTDQLFTIDDPSCGAVGASVSLRVASEGTFTGGVVAAGTQTAFNRLRILASGLCNNTTYHFVTPYGLIDATTSGTGVIKFVDDLGNVEGSRPIGQGGVLRWDPIDGAAPAGYLGDAVTLHTVIGSTYRPVLGGEPANYFAVQDFAGNELGRTDLFTVSGRLAGPIVSDTTSLSFGPTHQGTTSPSQTVTVTNLQRQVLTVAPTLTTATPFRITGGTCGISHNLGLDESCTVTVALDPALAETVGTKSSVLRFTHDGVHSPINVPLSGTVIEQGVPAVSFTPSSIAFGNQNVGTTSAARTVTITNTGTADLNITGAALSGTAANTSQFNFTNNCATIIVGGPACTITVRYAPTTIGAKTATLVISTNDPVRPTVSVTLTGNGVAPQVTVSPTTLSFSTKGTSTKSIQITNTGTAVLNLVGAPALTIQPSLLVTSDPTKFSASNGNCNNVAPGGKCTISVTFNPGPGANNQVYTANLQITSNAINPVVTVALTGTRK